MEFYERLKILRKKANLTQSEFSEKLGVHFQTISKWERGTFSPDIGMLGLIAETLGVTLEGLLGLSEADSPVVGAFDTMELAGAIADYRKGAGLSQTELAEKLGVTGDVVSKWERGVTSPDVDMLIKLSEAFAVTPSILYYGVKPSDETERTTYYRKKKPKWWVVATVGVGCAAAVATLAIVLIPKGKTYTVSVDGYQSYTVGDADWFTPSIPQKTGYEFLYFVDDGGERVEFPCKIAQDTTLYAQFSPIVYDVDYWLNGGVFFGVADTTITVEDGGMVLPVPEKAGDVFLGWYLTPDYAGEAVTKISCAASDVQVYAKWGIETYTIRYTLNGGVCAENPATVDKTTSYTLCEPTKAGYQFLGWFSSSEGGDKYTQVGGADAKNLSLHALWQKVDIFYDLTYHLQGGTLLEENPVKVAIGESFRLNTPTKVGHEFIGWCDEEDGNGNYYVWITGEKPLTLYAIFAPNEYVVRYKYEGVYVGEANPSFITYGQEVALQEVMLKGYDFDGWYDAEVGGKKISVINADNLLSITTLYARYTPKSFPVRLDGSGGQFTLGGAAMTEGELSYVYATTVTLPTCWKEGYTFVGWQDEEGSIYTELDVQNYHVGNLFAKFYYTGGYYIDYQLDGGSHVGTPPMRALPHDPQPLGKAEKTGYIFLGWNDAPDGEGNYYTLTPDFDGERITLYAVWQEVIVNGSSADFTYKKGAQQVTITKYTGSQGAGVDVVFPSYVDGLPVTEIAYRAIYGVETFEGPATFRSITLPTALTTLGEQAISVKEVLQPLRIPKTVTTLAKKCLEGKFDSITFEEGSALRTLGGGALSAATIGDVLVLPEGIMRVENDCMPYEATAVVFPQSLREIGSYALTEANPKKGTRVLMPLYLPSGVTSIAYKAIIGAEKYKIYTDIPVATLSTFSTGWTDAEVVSVQPSLLTLKDGTDTILSETGSAFLLPKREKAGHCFLGYKDESGAFVSNYYIMKSGATTLYAVYEPLRTDDGSSEDTARYISAEETTYEISCPVGKDFYFYLDTSKGNFEVTILVPKQEVGFTYYLKVGTKNIVSGSTGIQDSAYSISPAKHTYDTVWTLSFHYYCGCSASATVYMTITPLG